MLIPDQVAEMVALKLPGVVAVFDVGGAQTGHAQAILEAGAWTGASAGVNDAVITLYRSSDGRSIEGASALGTLSATARITSELDLEGSRFVVATILPGDEQSGEAYVTVRFAAKNPYATGADAASRVGGGAAPVSASFGEFPPGLAPGGGSASGSASDG